VFGISLFHVSPTFKNAETVAQESGLEEIWLPKRGENLPPAEKGVDFQLEATIAIILAAGGAAPARGDTCGSVEEKMAHANEMKADDDDDDGGISSF